MAKSESGALVRPLGIAATVVTLIQGLAWIVLASMKLSIHHGAWEWEVEVGKTYTKNLEAALYHMYLKGEAGNANFVINISPKELEIWAWIYLPLSILWAICSAVLLWGLLHKQGKYVFKLIAVWITFTAIISILDLILFSLLAADYSYFIENFNQISKSADVLQLYLFISCGAVMTVAIRGYLLWVFNVLFSIIMAKFTVDYMRGGGIPEELIKEIPAERHDNEPITAYDSSNIPADPWIKSESTSYVGIENPNFTRSHSFNFPEVTSDTNKRHGRYFDDENPGMPYIPEPDYTPPGTPKLRRPPLKSVLKQKSQYNNF